MEKVMEDCVPEPSRAEPTQPTTQPHTPGPWEVRWRFGRLTTVYGPQHYPICDTGTAPIANAPHQREEANARLIAAAPELLEALKEAVAEVEYLLNYANNHGGMFDSERCDYGRAAIAKAEGRA